MKPFRNPAAAIGLALAMLVPASTAYAQADKVERAQQVAAEMQKRFAAADANADGKLTKDEAKGKMPFVYKHYDEIDTTRSGAITLADIATYARTKQGARKAAP